MNSTNLVILTPSEIDTFLLGDRLEKLEKLIAPCVVMSGENMDTDAWRDLLESHNPEILVAGWKTPALPDDAVSTLAPALRYVCYLPGSVRHLVTRSMIEEGLLVTNWGPSISRTVAECALLLALSCMRRTAHWTHEMHYQKGWKDEATETQSLFERRVGIHGYGGIGQAIVPLLRPFTSKISVYTEGMPDEIYERDRVKKAGSVEELFSENDVIIEAEALTPERVGMVDEALLSRIPKGGTFVNVARGALVVDDDLLKLARKGHLQVGLDVYAVEPLPKDSGFRDCPNIMLLPHLGGPTTDRRCDAADYSLENLRRYRQGDALLSVVTPEVFDRST